MNNQNRLLNNIAQGLETTEKYRARSNMNAVVNIAVDSSAPLTITDTSTSTDNSETLSLNSRAFGVTSPIKLTNNVLSLDESNLVTDSMFATKQVALKSGKNVTVNGSTISAVDTTYSAGVGMTLNTNSTDSSKHTFDMKAATKTVFGGVFTDSNSKNLTITDGVLKIANNYNIDIQISNTPQAAYYSNSTAGYQPRITSDGNGKFTVHAGIKWSSDTSSGALKPLCNVSINGNHVGFGVSANKYSCTIGSATNPMFLSSGKFTAMTSSVAEHTYKPIYLDTGVLKKITCTIGREEKPVYVNSGVITPLTASVGKVGRPMYFTGTQFEEIGNTFYLLEYNDDGKWGAVHYRQPYVSDSTVMGSISALMKTHGLTNLYFHTQNVADDGEANPYQACNIYPQMNIMIDDMEVGKVYTIGLSISNTYSEKYFTSIIFNTNKGKFNGRKLYAYGFARGEMVIHATAEGYLAMDQDDFESPFSYQLKYSSPSVSRFDSVFKPFVGSDEAWGSSATSSFVESGVTYYRYTATGSWSTESSAMILPVESSSFNTPTAKQKLHYIRVMRGEDLGTNNNGATLYLIDWG